MTVRSITVVFHCQSQNRPEGKLQWEPVILDMGEELFRVGQDCRDEGYDRVTLLFAGGSVYKGVDESTAARDLLMQRKPEIKDLFDNIVHERKSMTTEENVRNSMRMVRDDIKDTHVFAIFPRGQAERGMREWSRLRSLPENRHMRFRVTTSMHHRTVRGEMGEEAVVVEPGDALYDTVKLAHNAPKERREELNSQMFERVRKDKQEHNW